jgi:hypothetical protein
VTDPNCSLEKLRSGAPEMFIGELPTTVDSGVKPPPSSAAVAVTTLNVEPGG